MSATLFDAVGNKFLIDAVLDSERDSYASLFSSAVVYRARYIGAGGSRGSGSGGGGGGGDDAAAAIAATPSASPTPVPPPEQKRTAVSPKPNAVSDAVMVTYIPLTSLLLGDATFKDAAALGVLQDHVRLRRQVEHPLLRSLFDVFYTAQQLAAPVSQQPQQPASGMRRPVEVSSPGAARLRTQPVLSTSPEAGGAARDGDVADRADATTAPVTALVLIEELIDGCSLADYADAVTRRHLTPNNAKLQRDAAALAYQLAQLLHHLHGTGHMLCRELPLGCVWLDQNRGSISVRMPLSAAHMLSEAGSRQRATAAVAAAAATYSQSEGSDWAEELRKLQAPELRNMAYWDPTATVASDSPSFGAADMWMLGVVVALLCALNHKQLNPATRTEKVAVLGAEVHALLDMLPSDTPDALLHLIRSCVDTSPAKRPTAAAVLRSSAFLAHRSHTELEQHRAVISIAEAVAQTRRRKMPPASLQLAESNALAATSRAATSATTSSSLGAGDGERTLLSLQDVVWDISSAYRDVFSSPESAARPPTAANAAGAHLDATPSARRRGSPSLSLAAQEARQDVERLGAQYEQLYGSESSCPSSTESPTAQGRLKERLRRSKQMPRDLPATARALEELTERFAHLEQTNPDAAFRLIELMVEGLASCPADLATMQESVGLADALLHTSPLQVTPSEAGADRTIAVEEARLFSSLGEVEQRDFQVADVLRVMPSMPERMIESDRAANTSAVLYNKWLKKEKKKFVKWDGY